MHWHILHCELNLDWQAPELYHLAQTEPDGNGPDILRRRIPIRQDVTRIPKAPALAEKECGDGLQVHLVCVGPAVLPADRPPLLWKHAEEVLFGEVADHDTRPELPLALTSEPRGRGREDGGRPRPKNPVARVRRRQQLQQSQIA